MYRIYMCDSINTRKAVEIKSIKEIRKNIEEISGKSWKLHLPKV